MADQVKRLRVIGLLGSVAVVALIALITRFSGGGSMPVPSIPVNPTAAELRKIGFHEEHDGRFAPKGFGLSFDYPNAAFELLAALPEHGAGDAADGIVQRRRHFLFVDDESSPQDRRRLPLVRVIRVTYDEPFTDSRFKSFRAKFQRRDAASRGRLTKVDGRAALVVPFQTDHGSGETIYVAENDRLFQVITFAADDDREVQRMAQAKFFTTARFGK